MTDRPHNGSSLGHHFRSCLVDTGAIDGAQNIGETNLDMLREARAAGMRSWLYVCLAMGPDMR